MLVGWNSLSQPVSPQIPPQTTNWGFPSVWTQPMGYGGTLSPSCAFYHPQTETPVSEAQEDA